MYDFLLDDDILLLGRTVPDFPTGIEAAFNALMDALPNPLQRSYYGVSTMDATGNVLYFAAAEAFGTNEAEGYDTRVIPAGTYLARNISGWRTQTDCIKDYFGEMMQEPAYDRQSPAIEWYQNDEELVLLLRKK